MQDIVSEEFLDKTVTYLQTNGIAFAVDLVTALVVLIIGLWIARKIKALANKAMEKSGKVDGTLRPLLANLVYYAVFAIVVFAVLDQVGIETTGLIAALGAAGLAIGLALQGTLSNMGAGVLLLILKPLKVGEFVEGGGVTGTVEEIGLFMTRLKTGDGVFLTVPNSALSNTAIKNFSRNPTRRMDIPMGIAYDDDIPSCRALLLSLMTNDERVLADPAPQTMVTSLGDSAVVITMRCWTTTGDFWATQWEMTERAKLALDDAGFTIPFPQTDVHFHKVAE